MSGAFGDTASPWLTFGASPPKPSKHQHRLVTAMLLLVAAVARPTSNWRKTAKVLSLLAFHRHFTGSKNDSVLSGNWLE